MLHKNSTCSGLEYIETSTHTHPQPNEKFFLFNYRAIENAISHQANGMNYGTFQLKMSK